MNACCHGICSFPQGRRARFFLLLLLAIALQTCGSTILCTYLASGPVHPAQQSVLVKLRRRCTSSGYVLKHGATSIMILISACRQGGAGA